MFQFHSEVKKDCQMAAKEIHVLLKLLHSQNPLVFLLQ